MVQELWTEMVGRPAVSANAGHAALIAGALALARTVYSFYQTHKDLIDPAAAALYREAQKRVTKKVKAQQRNSAKPKQTKNTLPPAPPPLPPRPPRAQKRTKTTGAVST